MLQSENARYIHSPTYPNTLILCTQHACHHTPKHAQIVHVLYMHPPIQTRAQYAYIYVCATYMHAHIAHATYMHARIVHATYMHHPP